MPAPPDTLHEIKVRLPNRLIVALHAVKVTRRATISDTVERALDTYLRSLERSDGTPLAKAVSTAMEIERKEPPTVLVVDTKPEERSALAVAVRRAFRGARVSEAATPQHAMQLLEQGQTFSAIVADEEFEGADGGIEMLAKVAEKAPRARRILMTGKSDPRVETEAFERARAHAVLEKPFSRSELLQAIAPRAS